MFEDITKEILDLIEKYKAMSSPASFDGGKTTVPAFRIFRDLEQLCPIGISESPVRKYAEKYNLPDIVGTYRKPEGLVFGEMQDYVLMLDSELNWDRISKQDYNQKIENLWGALCKLNPELKNIDVSGIQKIKKKRAAIIGVDDGYNVSDLDFFNRELVDMMNSFNVNARRKLNRGVYSISDEYDELANYVEDNSGRFSWRPSMQTLTYIKGKLLGKKPTLHRMHFLRPPKTNIAPTM